VVCARVLLVGHEIFGALSCTIIDYSCYSCCIIIEPGIYECIFGAAGTQPCIIDTVDNGAKLDIDTRPMRVLPRVFNPLRPVHCTSLCPGV